MASRYKPETPRRGTELATTKLNIENAYAILNRLDDRIANLETQVDTFINITFPNMVSELKNFSLMAMDDD